MGCSPVPLLIIEHTSIRMVRTARFARIRSVLRRIMRQGRTRLRARTSLTHNTLPSLFMNYKVHIDTTQLSRLLSSHRPDLWRSNSSIGHLDLARTTHNLLDILPFEIMRCDYMISLASADKTRGTHVPSTSYLQ
jgi:hypothetical protein